MKTIQELEKMTDEELNATLGKLLKITPDRSWAEGGKGFNVWPRYCDDLNLCAAVESQLKFSGKVEFNGSLYYSQQTFYICNLADVLRGAPAGTFSWPAYGLGIDQTFEITTAKPRQRTIALIATLQA